MIQEMEELKKHRRLENNEEKGEMESRATEELKKRRRLENNEEKGEMESRATEEEEETHVEKIERESSREKTEYLNTYKDVLGTGT